MTRLKRQAPHRNDSGMILGLAIVGLFLFAMAGTAIALVIAAHTRALLNRDADAEAANALASAENVIDALVANDSPEGACEELHFNYPADPLNPPTGCPLGPTDWTGWMSLPGRNGCESNILEGCWRAKFTTGIQEVQVPGRDTTVSLPVWTITVEAAARCDGLPDQNNPAAQVCETATDEAVLTYETNPLPVYPTLLYSGRFWPDSENATTADCAIRPEMTPVWCDIPPLASASLPADAQVSISTQVAAEGFFVNDLPGFTCTTAYCEIAPLPNVAPESARTLRGLPLANLADGACSSDPAVVKWAQPSLIAAIQTATLPADMPTDMPGMIVATGEVTITDSINGDDSNTPELETLLIVSGCHIVIGECVMDHFAYDPLLGTFVPTETEADSGLYAELGQCDEPDPADYLTVGDPVPDSMRLASTNITLDNVIIVAAGGVWAPELQPVVGTECSYAAPELIIQGSVITGHAGATSRLWDCDGDSVPEMIAAGYDRSSELPGPEAWATADIAWWPERQHGVWRRQGAPVRVTVDAGSTVDPGLSVNPATVTVTEGSTARLVAVALATQPSADVTVNVRQTPTAVLLVTPTLEFTEDDWDAEYVTVDASAYQDTDTIDNRITVTLTADSTDTDYDGLTQDVAVTITDDDIPALVVSAEPLTVEEDSTATFTVSLATAPTAPVTVAVNVGSGATAATVSPPTLTFTSLRLRHRSDSHRDRSRRPRPRRRIPVGAVDR